MKAKQKKEIFLSRLFLHLDGIAIIPTVLALENQKIISEFKNCSLSEISQQNNANEAYLNVALRLLCSQGILEQNISDDGEIYFNKKNNDNIQKRIDTYNLVAGVYEESIDYSILHKSHNITNTALFQITNNFIKKYQKTKERDIFYYHIEGAILSPIIVELALKGYFDNITNTITNFKQLHPLVRQLIENLFICTQILDHNKTITDYGKFILNRSTSYGVTVSYLPTFQNIKNLIFGNYKLLWTTSGDTEKHVDRGMNVWGSGGAHNTYFKKIDKIIIDVFNRPIQEQPQGFIDVGCGNGKFIEHVFNVICKKTQRGKQLNQYPLTIIGCDYNHKAIEITQKNLHKVNIKVKTIIGDISEPNLLAKKIQKKYQVNLEDLLNMRSFLDHNRIYYTPKNEITQKIKSSGAFCKKGQRITNNALQQNFKEHLEKWAPYLKKYGLLIVELHTMNPKEAANNIGKIAMTAYDASHGFSDQYILEYDVFLELASDVGLRPDPMHEYKLPSNELTIVSINRLVKK
ncbi:MAG: polyketide synthase [Flavobacteriales bacterium]|nr:polyketide synthase [Flavobacteriales bacterium]